MLAEHAAFEIDDVAGARRIRPQLGDDVGVAPLGHEADVLAVGLLGNGEAEFAGEATGLVLRQFAQGETQEIELLGCGGVEEVALVASRIQGAVEAAPAGFEGATGHVMAGRQHVGIEVAGGGQEDRGT